MDMATGEGIELFLWDLVLLKVLVEIVIALGIKF